MAENIVGKGENASYQFFSFYHCVFYSFLEGPLKSVILW